MTLLATARLAVRSRLPVAPRQDGDVCDDMALLLPSFREQVELVLTDMRALGHNPRVFETRRSVARVALLVARGTGSWSSMHPHDVAVDVICADKLWKATGAFWRDLTICAEARGLTCGSRFKKRHDMPHIQAIPVSAQATFLRTPREERDAFCATYYRVPMAEAA